MSVIVQTSSTHYGASMIAALLRLLTVLALVLMPFGMVSIPAAAEAMAADHATMPMGHCGDQSDQDKAPAHTSQQMHCAMCAALPASEPPTPAAGVPPSTPRSIATVSRFDGIELEIATPPPRRG